MLLLEVVVKVKKKAILFLFMFTLPVLVCRADLGGMQFQYKETIKMMTVLQKAILEYVTDYGHAPKVNTIKELMNMDSGNGISFGEFYLPGTPEKRFPTNDGFGNPLRYKYYRNHKTRFRLGSAGSDGRFEGFNHRGVYLENKMANLRGKDVIFSQRGPVYFPMDEHDLFYVRIFYRVYLCRGLFFPGLTVQLPRGVL